MYESAQEKTNSGKQNFIAITPSPNHISFNCSFQGFIRDSHCTGKTLMFGIIRNSLWILNIICT